MISLSDAFGNPISDKKIEFTITQGDGRFLNYQPSEDAEASGLGGVFKKKNAPQYLTSEINTDKDGRAEAYLVVGSIPGVNQVKAISKDLPKSPVVFDAMAQPEEEVPA